MVIFLVLPRPPPPGAIVVAVVSIVRRNRKFSLMQKLNTRWYTESERFLLTAGVNKSTYKRELVLGTIKEKFGFWVEF